MSDEYHMNLLSSWDEDLFALERNFPEEYAPYRMAIRIAAALCINHTNGRYQWVSTPSRGGA